LPPDDEPPDEDELPDDEPPDDELPEDDVPDDEEEPDGLEADDALGDDPPECCAESVPFNRTPWTASVAMNTPSKRRRSNGELLHPFRAVYMLDDIWVLRSPSWCEVSVVSCEARWWRSGRSRPSTRVLWD